MNNPTDEEIEENYRENRQFDDLPNRGIPLPAEEEIEWSLRDEGRSYWGGESYAERNV